MNYYIYVDIRHNIAEVFTTLDAAKRYSYKYWGSPEDTQDEWVQCTKSSWEYCEYGQIYKRTVIE